MTITDQQAAFYDGFIEENVVRAGQAILQVAYLLNGMTAMSEPDGELSPLTSDPTPLFVEIDTFALACWKLREAFWFVKTKKGVRNEFDVSRTTALQARYDVPEELFTEAHAVRRRIEHTLEDIDEIVKGRATVSTYSIILPQRSGGMETAAFRCLTTNDLTYYQSGHALRLPVMVRQLLQLIARGQEKGRFWKSTVPSIVTTLDPLFPALGGFAFKVSGMMIAFDMQVYEPGYFDPK